MSARNTFAATRRSHAITKWLQNGEDVTIQRVIDAFDIKYPQAREDLKLLEELYLLSTRREGRIKVWRWSGFNPEYISVATAAALELGSIALDLFQDTPYLYEIERLAEHCRDRVGGPQRERLDRVSRALHLRRTWLPVDEESMTEHTETILDAVFRDRGLAMLYSRADGAVRHYIITPRKLVWYAGRLWLLARHENHTKLFDVAGIASLDELRGDHGRNNLVSPNSASADNSDDTENTDHEGGEVELLSDGGANKEDRAAAADSAEPAAPEEGLDEQDPEADAVLPAVDSDEDLEKYFENAFGIYAQNYPVADVHLEVSGSWANYLRRYRIHPSQQNEEGEDALHVHLRLGLCPEFRTFVLGMIPSVRVHAPVEFVEELDETIREWLEKNPPAR